MGRRFFDSLSEDCIDGIKRLAIRKMAIYRQARLADAKGASGTKALAKFAARDLIEGKNHIDCEAAITMLQKGYTLDVIYGLTGLSRAEINRLISRR